MRELVRAGLECVKGRGTVVRVRVRSKVTVVRVRVRSKVTVVRVSVRVLWLGLGFGSEHCGVYMEVF